MITTAALYVRRHAVAFLALFVAVGGSAGAVAAASSSSPVLTACVSKGSGAVHLIGQNFARRCGRGQVRISWNQQGVPGLTGPKGDTGLTGPKGDTGPSTGPAGGDLTGNYPNPTIAPAAVTTADFHAGAQAPDSAKLGGFAAAAYPQATAHQPGGVSNGFGPLVIATLPGMGTLSLQCSSSNAIYTYTNTSGATTGYQFVSADNGGTVTHASVVNTQTFTTEVLGTGPDVHLVIMVNNSSTGPSGEFDLLTEQKGGDCREQFDSLLMPSTVP